MPSVAANGLRIEYESLGDPQAPAIVLLMGLGMQLVDWPDAFCEDLVAQGFRVVRFDNRDSGLSTEVATHGRPNLLLAFAAAWVGLPVRAPYTLDDMAADTLGLIDGLGIAKAHIVGISMGGMIAQVFAARHPERVLTLTSIMSSSGNRQVSLGTRPALEALFAKPSDPNDPQAVVDHLVKVFGVIGSPAFPSDTAELRQRLARSVHRAYHPAGIARQLLAIMAAGDRRRQLRTIVAPTLVIHGAADPLLPVAAGRDTARNIPGAELLVIDGMGHDLPLEVLPRLAEAIGAHCRKAPR